MKSILSIIYLQTSAVSGERIAIGLLGISDKEVFFKWAESKLKLVARLVNADILTHAELTCKLIQNKVADSNKEAKSGKLVMGMPVFTEDYLHYLNKYSKGLLQFEQPKWYAGEINKKTFKTLFQQFIGNWEEEIENTNKATRFHQAVKAKLKKPVFEKKADINYTLLPGKVKGILLPHDITLISKNGHLLAAQAIDFTIAPELIGKQVYELESVYRSLEQWSQKHIKNANKGQYYLLFNPPAPRSAQEVLLNDIRNAKSDFMQIEEADYLEDIENDLAKGRYEKFSESLKTA